MSHCGTEAEDDLQSLASNLHSHLGLGDLKAAGPNQDNRERPITAGPPQNGAVDGSLEDQPGQNVHCRSPFDDTFSQEGLEKSCPLGELSTNILKFPVDSASSMQQACTDGKQENVTSMHAPLGHQVIERSNKFIDNLVYDISHADESVAIRLSSTGSSGSTDWFGTPSRVNSSVRGFWEGVMAISRTGRWWVSGRQWVIRQGEETGKQMVE